MCHGHGQNSFCGHGPGSYGHGHGSLTAVKMTVYNPCSGVHDHFFQLRGKRPIFSSWHTMAHVVLVLFDATLLGVASGIHACLWSAPFRLRRQVHVLAHVFTSFRAAASALGRRPARRPSTPRPRRASARRRRSPRRRRAFSAQEAVPSDASNQVSQPDL